MGKIGVRKGPWTAEEDEKLVELMRERGDGGKGCRWPNVPRAAGLNRCGKSCRLRWFNYLRPGIKRGNYSPQEDDVIVHLHSILGNKWSAIAKRLPGRTDNEIKNYWHCNLSKKLLQKGIDPVTHKPILVDNNDPTILDNLQHLLDAATNNAIKSLMPDHVGIDRVIHMLNTIIQLLETTICTNAPQNRILHPSFLDNNLKFDQDQSIYGPGHVVGSSQVQEASYEISNQMGVVGMSTPSDSLPLVSGFPECSKLKRKMNPNDVSNFSSTSQPNWEEFWDDEAGDYYWRQFGK